MTIFKDCYKDVAKIFERKYKENAKKGIFEFTMLGVPSSYNCDFKLLFLRLKTKGFKIYTREKRSYWGMDIKISKL